MCGPTKGLIAIANGSHVVRGTMHMYFNRDAMGESSAPTELGRELEQTSSIGRHNQPHFWLLSRLANTGPEVLQLYID